MSTAWIWIFFIVLIAGAAFAGYKYRGKLKDSGQIVDREAGFEEYQEIFTIKEMPFSEILEALKVADYYQKANISWNMEREAVGFSGSGWSAQLYHMTDDDRNAYCFEFLSWDTHRGVPYAAIAMNTVLTAVERTFLSLDANTQVSSKKNAIKTKHKFFQ